MIFHLLTTFPDIFSSYFSESILGRAQKSGAIQIKVHNLRDFTADKHKTTDDTPYGGGAGMVMKIEPIFRALESILPKRITQQGIKNQGSDKKSRVILTSARGAIFNQKKAQKYTSYEDVIIICGHYEGVDQRVADHFCDEELSIGQYVLTGGELAAMTVVDATSRLLPGVLGNAASLSEESFSKNLKQIEYPHYTRPADFQGLKVPADLLSGDHEKIENWRKDK